MIIRRFLYFYSRPSARGDHRCSRASGERTPISTHAPLRGATWTYRLFKSLPGLFLLTPLCEGRPRRGRGSGSTIGNFYSRPSARGDASRKHACITKRKFLLTPLCEGRLAQGAMSALSLLFLLTPLCEGRRTPPILDLQCAHYFYSRPSARGDAKHFEDFVRHTISTHAPLRGATRIRSTVALGETISTHAPLRGATCLWLRNLPLLTPFLLTPLCEGRPGFPVVLPLLIPDFYSRPSARGDVAKEIFRIAYPKFLLTPLCEGRPCKKNLQVQIRKISTHAPLRGATSFPGVSLQKKLISTHAPLRGAT